MGVVGMCICNDRRWPETFRVMGLQGVEIVALGYNTPSWNINWPEPDAPAHVPSPAVAPGKRLSERPWVVAAAKGGKEDGFGLIGGSASSRRPARSPPRRSPKKTR